MPIIAGAALGGLWLLDPGPAPDIKDDGATRSYLGMALALRAPIPLVVLAGAGISLLIF
jgi:hypothetical protein